MENSKRFSIRCLETETKAISLTKDNRRRQRDEPVRTRGKYMEPAQSARKRVLFWFFFSLVEKLPRVLSTNHRAQ